MSASRKGKKLKPLCGERREQAIACLVLARKALVIKKQYKELKKHEEFNY